MIKHTVTGSIANAGLVCLKNKFYKPLASEQFVPATCPPMWTATDDSHAYAYISQLFDGWENNFVSEVSESSEM